MRDFATSLRRELKLLEDQIAADPRLRKVQKIRELLAIYEEAGDAAVFDRSGDLPGRRAALPAVQVERPKAKGIRSAIEHFMRRSNSATIARLRLAAMAQSNHWPNASPAWLQLQMDASGRPLTYENVFGSDQVDAAETSVLQMEPPANGRPSREPETSSATARATTPNGGVERHPTMDKPIGLVLQDLKTA